MPTHSGTHLKTIFIYFHFITCEYVLCCSEVVMWTSRSTTGVYRGGGVQHSRGTRALVIAGVVGSSGFPGFLYITGGGLLCFLLAQGAGVHTLLCFSAWLRKL